MRGPSLAACALLVALCACGDGDARDGGLDAPEADAGIDATLDAAIDAPSMDLGADDAPPDAPSSDAPLDAPATDLDIPDATPDAADAGDMGTHSCPTLDCSACTEACSWACTDPLCDPVASVNVGFNHSCAVRASGRVDCWGRNAAGQLGDGTTTLRTTPVRVTGLDDAIEVSAGIVHTCALRRGGTVVCWGENADAQLGDSGASRLAPGADVPGLTGIVHLTSGETHTCALDSAGAVTCWGDTLAPAPVAALPPVDFIDTGATMTCAIRRADSVATCWGRGALGDGSYYATDTPAVTVGGATPLVVRDVAVGPVTTCAVDDTGSAWCWGSNLNSMLGDGSTMHDGTACGGTDCAVLPNRVTGITTGEQLALGWHTGCVVLTGGQITCWGFNGAWDLGAGGPMTMVADVPLLSGVADATSVAGKDVHFCAQRAPGGVSCWGLNLFGELGDGTMTATAVPVVVVPP